MKNKQTITIGIPAYNEASNITRLIADLVAQVQRDFLMEKIIVVSDASTDGTADVVEKIRKTRVEVIENRERRGKAHSLNLIKDKSTSDILLLLDADIRIPDTQFINNLITPIVKGQAAITYAKIREDRPTNFLSNILFASMIFKHGIFESWNNGDNIYTAVGRARAVSKPLYKQFDFKLSNSEDSYTYLFAKTHGFGYRYVKNAIVLYQLPKSIKDHSLQGVRFEHSKKMNIKEFGFNLVNQSYAIPTSLIIKSFIKTILQSPLIVFYFLLQISVYIESKLVETDSNIWHIAKSSK